MALPGMNRCSHEPPPRWALMMTATPNLHHEPTKYQSSSFIICSHPDRWALMTTATQCASRCPGSCSTATTRSTERCG